MSLFIVHFLAFLDSVQLVAWGVLWHLLAGGHFSFEPKMGQGTLC